jgi:Domain of unknown function (DUF4835)
LVAWSLSAQELNFKVKVNVQRLSQADPSLFNNLEQAMREYLNDGRWTEDDYREDERIKGVIQFTIMGEAKDRNDQIIPNVYQAELLIETYRPVYGHNYESTLMSYIDKDITFKYEQFQNLQYSQNQFTDNLSMVLAYWAMVTLGMDYDSFSSNGGDRFYQQAQQIVNSSQSNNLYTVGWTANSGLNRDNRYWLLENLISPRMKPMRELNYIYHRLALDVITQDAAKGRSILAKGLENAQTVYNLNPNTILMQIFLNAKSKELLSIFQGGDVSEKNQVADIMSRIDAANANLYRQLRY